MSNLAKTRVLRNRRKPTTVVVTVEGVKVVVMVSVGEEATEADIVDITETSEVAA